MRDLYSKSTSQSAGQSSKVSSNLPEVVESALKDDLESHRVMYQYLFTENKRKENPLTLNESNSLGAQTSSEGKKELKYISALNTKKNPDILLPGAFFLKGNKYFKKDVAGEVQQSESNVEEKGLESSEEQDE